MKKRLIALVVLCAAGLVASSLAFGAPARRKAPRVVYRESPRAICPGSSAADEPNPKPEPSKSLLAAFAILRRDRVPADALPANVVANLRARGASFDPLAARQLRLAPDGGKAWIVPVEDVNAVGPDVLCGRVLDVPRVLRAPIRPRKGVSARKQAQRLRTVLRRQRALLRAAPVPALPAPAFGRPRAKDPEEGVIVVSVNGAPAGGGGALDDVLRGRTMPEVRPCSGPSGRLTSVSGVVPDGVEAAFLTSPDGTAVKADVHQNSYSFLVAPFERLEARYVVWLREGFPHVQPLPRVVTGTRCPPRFKGAIEVTPSPYGALLDAPAVAFAPPALPAPSAAAPLPAVPRLPRLVAPKKR